MSKNAIRAFANRAVSSALPSWSETDDRNKQVDKLRLIANETIGDAFTEEDPSVAEWFRSLVPSSEGVGQYARDLFPSAQWMRRYNVHWLIGDAIAGKSGLNKLNT